MVRFGRHERRIKWGNTLAFFALVIGLACLGLSLSGFTGFLVSTESFYTSSGFEASQSGDFVWSPEHEGLLTSVKLTGYIEGNGSVKVFLRSGSGTFLILDSSLLPGGNLTAPANETSQAEQVGENATVERNETGQNETGQMETTPEQNQTTGNGSVQNETPHMPQGNITLDNNATANETGTGITGNLMADDNQNLTEPAENASENVTVPPPETTNQTRNETVWMLRFEDICVETCTLPALNESSYTLAFEIENGTVLHIESLRYSLLRYETPINLPPAGQIPDQTVEAGQTLNINLSMHFSDPEGEPMSFTVDSSINYSFIDVDVLTITPSQEGNFTITVSASDGTSTVFSSFRLFVLPSNISELNATNITEIPANLSCSGCTDCSEKILFSPPGSIILLDSDISSSWNCIQLSGSVNLTLDCGGHRIGGSGKGCGVVLNGSRENMLKNCIIEGFYIGVYLDKQSRGNRLVSLGVSGNDYGVSLFSSSSNDLESIEGNIRVSSSSRNAIKCGF
jgi:hypothetical protein